MIGFRTETYTLLCEVEIEFLNTKIKLICAPWNVN